MSFDLSEVPQLPYGKPIIFSWFKNGTTLALNLSRSDGKVFLRYCVLPSILYCIY